MENYKSCLFIGHRSIKITDTLINRLHNVIDNMINKYSVNRFLFGSRSQFNDLCYDIVTKIKDNYNNIERIAYLCKSEALILEKDKDKWLKIFSDFSLPYDKQLFFDGEVEYKNKFKSQKGSYVERNYAMINDADYCIFYYDKNYNVITNKYNASKRSGTELAYIYAVRKNKKIINLFYEN